LAKDGFKLSKSPYLPTKTLQIDLTQPKDKIYANFTKDCKYNIKRGDNIKVKEPTRLQMILKSGVKRGKIQLNLPAMCRRLTQLINLRKSFPGNYSLFLASHNISGNVIGGALFTRSLHDICYYWYGFTNSEGRTSLSQYSLLYQGILWAKKIGCKVFDFEGIYDVRFPNKSWLGFSHFKKSFGGTEVFYPGCYTKLSLLNSLGRI
jgi:peptidoglycan pentaglycine glycine transferase (the first glycine)